METPTLRQLECLVAAAEAQSFSRAAEACFITQPSLSAQIAQLEALLGVDLFERRGRRVFLTSAGQELSTAARRILASARELVDAAAAHKHPLTGTVRLGVIPTVAPYYLPRALARAQASYPDLRLLIREDTTARLCARLEAGELDVLMIATGPDLGNVETAELCEDRFFLAVPARHRLARRKRVSTRDLAEEQVLFLEDGHCLRDQAFPFCERAGAREHADFRAASLTTLVQMVSGGVGVTLLPEMAIAVEAHPERELTLLPFTGTRPGRTIVAAWRRGAVRAAEYRLLAAALRA